MEMSKKVAVLTMAVMVLMASYSGGAAAAKVIEHEANEQAGSEMIAVPRKMVKNGGPGLGICLLVGSPCRSDEDCFSGCYCKPIPLVDFGYCGCQVTNMEHVRSDNFPPKNQHRPSCISQGSSFWKPGTNSSNRKFVHE